MQCAYLKPARVQARATPHASSASDGSAGGTARARVAPRAGPGFRVLATRGHEMWKMPGSADRSFRNRCLPRLRAPGRARL